MTAPRPGPWSAARGAGSPPAPAAWAAPADRPETRPKRKVERQPLAIALPFAFGAFMSPGVGLALVAWNSLQLDCPARVRHAALAVFTAAGLMAANLWWVLEHGPVHEARAASPDIALDRRYFVIWLKVFGLLAIAAITAAQSDALRFRLGAGGALDARFRAILKIFFYAVVAAVVGSNLVSMAFGSFWSQTVLRPLMFLT